MIDKRIPTERKEQACQVFAATTEFVRLPPLLCTTVISPGMRRKDVKSLFRICPPIEAMCVQFPVKVVDAGHDLLSIPDPDVRDLFRLLRIVYNRDFPPEFRLRALGQYGEEQGTSLLTWRTFGVVSHTDVRPFLEKASRDQECEDRNMVNIIADAEKHWKAAGEATGEARGIIIAALELGAPESRIVALLAKNLKLTESQARQKYYDYLEAEREKAEENVG